MSSSSPPASNAGRKKRLWAALRWIGTFAGFAYIAWVIEDVDTLLGAVSRTPPFYFVIAVALIGLNLLVGSVRWRLLLKTYGASRTPGLLRLVYLYFVGFFYNSFLPGAVGGDVVRGVVTKEAFGEEGMTSAVTVVLVERALGLVGLICLSAGALWLAPLPNVPSLGGWAAAGLVGAGAGIAALAQGRRLSQWMPGRLKGLAQSLPVIKRPAGFVGVWLCSVLIHAIVGFAGFLFLHSQMSTVTVGDAMVIVPVATATAFLPFTVGGAGAREAAFIVLCGTALSMDASSATAASLLLWGSQLTVAAAGGVLQLFIPLQSGTEER